VQVTGSEVASLPVQLIVTWWLYQPFESGLRAGAAELATGGVESYLSAKEVEAELPAWSVQVTPGAALALSGPLYVVESGQLASPERESLPFQVTVTGLLYQPFVFAGRSALGLSTGGVESYLSGTEVEAELPAWSVQVTPGAALALSGPLYVVELGQLAIPEVASLPCQLTVTELLYQPFAFGFRSGLGANTGGVESYLSGKETDAELPA
jgi:hypothetical protein